MLCNQVAGNEVGVSKRPVPCLWPLLLTVLRSTADPDNLLLVLLRNQLTWVLVTVVPVFWKPAAGAILSSLARDKTGERNGVE